MQTGQPAAECEGQRGAQGTGQLAKRSPPPWVTLRSLRNQPGMQARGEPVLPGPPLSAPSRPTTPRSGVLVPGFWLSARSELFLVPARGAKEIVTAVRGCRDGVARTRKMTVTVTTAMKVTAKVMPAMMTSGVAMMTTTTIMAARTRVPVATAAASSERRYSSHSVVLTLPSLFPDPLKDPSDWPRRLCPPEGRRILEQ